MVKKKKINRKRLIGFKDGNTWKTYYIKPDGSYKITTTGTYGETLKRVSKNAKFDKTMHIIPANKNKSDMVKRIINHNHDISLVKKLIKKFPKESDIKLDKKVLKQLINEKYNDALWNYQVKKDSGLKAKKPLKKDFKLSKKELKSVRSELYNKFVDQSLSKSKRVNMENDVLKIVNKRKKAKREIAEEGRQYVIFKDVRITYQYGTSPRLYVGNNFRRHIQAFGRIIDRLKYFSITMMTERDEVLRVEFFNSDLKYLNNVYKKLDIVLDKLAERALRLWGKERIVEKNVTFEVRELL
jgi:hypothetical protein